MSDKSVKTSLLSEGILRVKPSMNLELAGLASQLMREGKDVIQLDLGEPDLKPPQEAFKYVEMCIENEDSRYPSLSGKKELLHAIVKKLKIENNLEYSINQVLVCNGAKQAIFNLFALTLNLGDEVLVMSPYWFAYENMVDYLGAKFIPVKCLEDFSINFEDLKQKLDKNKTKWVVLNYPNNPSGYYPDEQELLKLAEILKQYPDVQIMSDEIYEHIIYDDGKYINILNVCSELYNRTYIVNGLSKAYAMPGWRIGYVALGNEVLAKKAISFQNICTSGVSTLSQYAAIGALEAKDGHGYLKDNVVTFKRRRDLVFSYISQIDGLKMNLPKGAFYAFIDVSSLFGRKSKSGKLINSSLSFASYILEEFYISASPGILFGVDTCFRISYATSDEILVETCVRLKRAVEELV